MAICVTAGHYTSIVYCKLLATFADNMCVIGTTQLISVYVPPEGVCLYSVFRTDICRQYVCHWDAWVDQVVNGMDEASILPVWSWPPLTETPSAVCLIWYWTSHTMCVDHPACGGPSPHILSSKPLRVWYHQTAWNHLHQTNGWVYIDLVYLMTKLVHTLPKVHNCHTYQVLVHTTK